MDYEHIFPLLTNQEFAVLYWKCQGLTHEDIALKFSYSAAWIQEHSSKAHKKLGITGHPSQREKVLQEKVCPALFEWVKQNPERIKALPPPIEQVQQSVVGFTSEKSASTPSSNKTVEPPPITIKNPKALPGPSVHWFVRLLRYAIFALVGFLLVSAVGFFAFQYGRTFTQSPPVVANSPIPTLPIDTPTLVVESSPTLEVPPTIEATQTSIPTPIPPTETSTSIPPTPTVFVPPVDGILFQDTFDQTMSPEWQQITGTWLVSNGKLTKLAYEGDGWAYEWISYKKPGVKNFILSLDITRPSTNSPDEMAFIVASDGQRQLGIEIDSLSYIYWGFIGDSWSDTNSLTGERDYQVNLAVNLQIEVDNELYTLYINGREVQVLNLPGYTSDEIKLGIDCGNSNAGCATIDNVKLTYLP